MNLGGEAAAASEDSYSSAVSRWTFKIAQRYQHVLDKSTPHLAHRWSLLGVLALIYLVRVCILQGFYLITYGLGIYILQLLIAFLSPQVDPETQAITAVDDDGGGGEPPLPTRGSDEFRPFVRRLPEFKLWLLQKKQMSSARAVVLGSRECYPYLDKLPAPCFLPEKSKGMDLASPSNIVVYSLAKAICIAFVLTFFSVFNVPVFWPILLFYWLVLFISTMKRQLMHMIKYRYVPFTSGKQRYTAKKVTSSDDAINAEP